MRVILALLAATGVAVLSAIAFALIASWRAEAQAKGVGTPVEPMAVAVGLLFVAVIMAFATIAANIPATVVGMVVARASPWPWPAVASGTLAALILLALIRNGGRDSWVGGQFIDLPGCAPLAFALANGALLSGALSALKLGKG